MIPADDSSNDTADVPVSVISGRLIVLAEDDRNRIVPVKSFVNVLRLIFPPPWANTPNEDVSEIEVRLGRFSTPMSPYD